MGPISRTGCVEVTTSATDQGGVGTGRPREHVTGASRVERVLDPPKLARRLHKLSNSPTIPESYRYVQSKSLCTRHAEHALRNQLVSGSSRDDISPN